MSTTKADIELMVTARTAAQAIASVEQRMRTMLGSMETATRRQEKAAASVSQQMGGWAKGLGQAALASLGFMGTMQSIHTIVGLVRREIDAMVEVQEKAAERQLPFKKAVEQIREQMPSDTDTTVGQIRNAIMASRSGRDPTELANVVLGAISAESTAPVSERVNTALRTAELRPFVPAEQLQPLVEATLIQRRANPERTLDETIATIALAQSAARQTDPSMFAKNIIAPAAMLQQFGFTQQESLTFGAALGTSAEDPQGDVTRTALMNFATDLQKKAVETGLATDAADLMKKFQTGDESVAHLRTEFLGALDKSLADDPEELAKYRMVMAGKSDPGDLHGRARIKYYLSSMIQEWRLEQEAGENTAQAMYRDMMDRGVIKVGPEAAAEFEQRLAERYEDPENMLLLFDQAAKGFIHGREMDPNVGIRAKTVEFIEQLKLKTRGSALGARVEKFFGRLEAGEASPLETLEAVETAATSRQGELLSEVNYGPFGPKGISPVGRRGQDAVDAAAILAWVNKAQRGRQAHGMELLNTEAIRALERDVMRMPESRRRDIAFGELTPERRREAEDLQRIAEQMEMLVKLAAAQAERETTDGALPAEPRQIRDPAAAALEGLGN